MIQHRFRRLVSAAILALAPSLVLAQSALQQPNVGGGGTPAEPISAAVTKLYQNDLFLQNLVTGRFSALGAAALLNVGTITGTVADGGALAAEILRAQTAEQAEASRAQAAEQANTASIATNATAISAETSRAQGVEVLKAPIASPTFTGIPTAPTASAGTGTNQIATTQFVATAVAAGGGSGGGTGGVPTSRQILTGGLATGGGDLTADRTVTVPKAAQSDVATGTDDAKALTSYSVAAALGAKAALASPALVGTPTAPTATAGTNTTQIATTGFVTGALGSYPTTSSVSSTYAPLASPPLTGTPTAPTQAANDNSTKLATTAYADRVASGSAMGQVRLSFSSASALLVKPLNGNLININGTYQTVPSAGVTCSNSGLTAGTLYYAYLYVSGGSLTCEMVTTGHATSATTGIEIKSGDGTRTLVGMAYTAPGTPGTFADSPTQRYTASWFNQREFVAATLTNKASTTSSTYVALSQTLGALTWGLEPVTARITGNLNNSSNGTVYTMNYVDGTASGSESQIGVTSSFVGSPSSEYVGTLSEGLHTFVVEGSTNNGTVYFNVQQSVKTRL
ncbi:hypothetical protein [Methylobacterium sp. NEAU K]|uniref:hypothetical protein n=1 Tax=Methylobacterium sp. NEAU K TaxID=3064946 RepID=UPI0027348E5F|nr:hypothetical protein [Methylobacterium sp. NEAU K]MDP4005070.1 hypothetical protein [Methylobacterium sp. NEAU K]